MGRCRRVFAGVWHYRRAVILLAAPLALTAIVPYRHSMELSDRAASCLYVLLLMACYWTTEALDIAVTSLLPLAFFPFMGVMTAENVAKQYFKDSTVLLVGGFLLAAAIEKCGIQKRIALNLLRLIGSGERTLMMAFMLSTWFISMWISNTAATSIMITIAQSLLTELRESVNAFEMLKKNTMETHVDGADSAIAEGSGSVGRPYPTLASVAYMNDKEMVTINASKLDATLTFAATTSDGSSGLGQRIESDWLALGKGLSICVAYSASIGGMATLIGSGANIVLVENIEAIAETYPNITRITFASWSVVGLPLSVILLVVCWLWLQAFFFGFRMCSGNRTTSILLKKFFSEQCKRLGRISFQEVVVSALLFVLVLLWLTRDMGEAGGWGQLLDSPYAKDGTTAIAIGLLLFVIPSTLDAFPFMKSHRHSSEEPSRPQSRAILTWKEAQQKIPWGVVMLIGGGFALAEGVTAVGVGKHPLYFMFPTTLAASFAFMLPVATPPNAIVFSTGVLKVLDMVKAGLVMNIIGIGAVTFAMMTWGSVYFRLGEWNFGVVTNGSVALSNCTASQP